MKVEPRSEQSMSADNVRSSTGRDLTEWFDLLDASGGPGPGRRALTDRLISGHGLSPWGAQTIVVESEGARAPREKDGRPKGYAICVTKTLAAPAERVFEAFGDSAALGQWFGDGAKAAFKEGGELTDAHGCRCTYVKLAPPKTLRLAWVDADPALASQVEVKLAPKGDKTGLVLNHERIQSRELADGLRAAWGAAIERLKTHLER